MRRGLLSQLNAVVSAAALVALVGCDTSSDQPSDGAATGATATNGANGANGAQGTTAPPDAPWFEDRAADSGVRFTHQSGDDGSSFLFPEIVAGGVALFDADGDGDLDLYFVQSGRIVDEPAQRPGNQLYLNDGAGGFEDATEGSGAGDSGYGMGAAAGDYDNDGDIDLYVTNLRGNVLLQNDGTGVFRDVTAEAGVAGDEWSTSAAFLDYDGDGDLDLFVANYVHWSPGTDRRCFTLAGTRDYCGPTSYDTPIRDVLYRNDGGGTFTDVSVESGLDAVWGNGLGVCCGDFDGDGRVDIFVANDQTPDTLWLNQGDGAFADGAALMGCAIDQNGQPKAGMGTAACDVDDDGDLDLLVVNLSSESDSFFRNEGSYFADRTSSVGLTVATRQYTRWGLALLDFDNDGIVDIYQANGRVVLGENAWAPDAFAESNLLLRGTSDGRYVEVAPRGGTAGPLVATSRGAAFGDIDGDGRVDVVVANKDGAPHILHNTTAGDAHWIMYRVLDEHGRDAIGATVSTRCGDRVVSRDVRSAYSYCAANDLRVHVGLGLIDRLDAVSVRWADGTVEAFGPVTSVDRVIELRRGGGAE